MNNSLNVYLHFISNDNIGNKVNGFALNFNVFIKDNFYYMNLNVDIYRTWFNDAENISYIPLCHISEVSKNVAILIKKIFGQYINQIYKLGKKNFKDNKQIGFTINDDQNSLKRLKNSYLCKYIRRLIGASAAKGATIGTGAVKVSRSKQYFCIYNTIHDLGYTEIREPYHYNELLTIKFSYPVIYSLLEKYGQLYTKYRKLKPELIKLVELYENETLPVDEYNNDAENNLTALGMDINYFCLANDDTEKVHIDSLSYIIHNNIIKLL